MASPRLRYEPVSLERLDDFHRLIQDAHVRRYLCDGTVYPRDWSSSRIRDSLALFDQRGVGLWLVDELERGELVGFCGFLTVPSMSPEPQLVYALFERWTGRGYATEMARAAIAEARQQPDFESILAGVDAVNVASIRVLEKLGFEHVGSQPGAFGDAFIMRLEIDT